MFRQIVVSFAVTILAFRVLLAQETAGPTTPNVPPPTGNGEPNAGGGGKTPAPNEGGGGKTPAPKPGNDSNGEEKWLKWNDTGMSENDTTWLVKYCPKGLTEAYEKVCIVHCWWNGWQGGYCTDDNICICRWDGLALDPGNKGSEAIALTDTPEGAAIGNNVTSKTTSTESSDSTSTTTTTTPEPPAN